MIDQRWTTVDGRVWTLGKDQYRATISLIKETYYEAEIQQLNDEGKWDDLVSYATFLTRSEAETHIHQVIDRLTALANAAEGGTNAF